MRLLGKAILESMKKSNEKKSTVGKIKEKLHQEIVNQMMQIKAKQEITQKIHELLNKEILNFMRFRVHNQS
jgi:hypothetical protein